MPSLSSATLDMRCSFAACAISMSDDMVFSWPSLREAALWKSRLRRGLDRGQGPLRRGLRLLFENHAALDARRNLVVRIGQLQPHPQGAACRVDHPVNHH